MLPQRLLDIYSPGRSTIPHTNFQQATY